jgi:ABC-type glycerol-3-phosphate transport system substrate-binding protein
MSESSNRYSRRALLQIAAVTPFGAALLGACGAGGTAATGSTSAAGSATLTTASTGSSIAASTSALATSSAASPAASTASTAASTASTSATASAATTSSAAAAPANAPKPTPTPAAGETHKGAALTLDLWYGWGGATAIQTWDALNKQMADALTGFNVRWLTADNNTKLLTAIAGGSPPNVAVGNAPYPEFWARGAGTALDAMVAKSTVDGISLKSDIPDAYWSYASYKGKIYGIPAVEAFARYGLCFDMTNLQKFNVDPKALPWDWSTLTQMQQQFTQKAANGSISVLGIDPLDAMGGSFGGSNPFYWAQAWGIDYYDEGTRKFNFDNSQLAEGLTILKKVYDIAGGAQAVAGFHNSYGTWTESPTAAMPSGVEDMNINGYWAPGELAHSSPNRQFAYTWAPVPDSKKGFKFQTLVGHQAFIPKGAKNTDNAFQLIEFLVGDTAEKTIFDGTGWLGARQSFLKTADFSKYNGLDFYVNSVKTADKLYGMPSNPIENYCGQQWGKVQQDVIYNRAQPADALKQLQQIVTNQLQQQFPNG